MSSSAISAAATLAAGAAPRMRAPASPRRSRCRSATPALGRARPVFGQPHEFDRDEMDTARAPGRRDRLRRRLHRQERAPGIPRLPQPGHWPAQPRRVPRTAAARCWRSRPDGGGRGGRPALRPHQRLARARLRRRAAAPDRRRACDRRPARTRIVAHPEADAFLLAYPATGDAARRRSSARRVARRLRPRAVRDRRRAGVTSTCTAGMALAPDHGDDAEVARAQCHGGAGRGEQAKDLPMLAYSEDLRARAARRMELERDLRRPSRSSEFELYYQPKFDAATRRLVGAEALLRWRHPERADWYRPRNSSRCWKKPG